MDENLDEGAIREMEEVLGTKIYPGTEIMKDVGTHHFVKGSNHRSVLVPQPSDDPRDPLNWSPFWKTTVSERSGAQRVPVPARPKGIL